MSVTPPLNPPPPPSFSWWGGGWWWGVVAYRLSLCLCVCPQILPLTSPFSTPTHHRSHPSHHKVHSTMMLRGPVFKFLFTLSRTMWLYKHKNQRVFSTYVGTARIVLGILGLGLLKKKTLRCRCYGLWKEAQAMRQVQPLT